MREPRLRLKPLALFVTMYCVGAVSHGMPPVSVTPSANQCTASHWVRETLLKCVGCVDPCPAGNMPPIRHITKPTTLTFMQQLGRIAPREY